MDRMFPAFCHISEYGEKSLKHFPRLVALSAPLVVWGPSAVELSAYGGAFTPRDFLDLVDDLNRAPPSPGRVLKGERERSGGIRRDRARLPWP